MQWILSILLQPRSRKSNSQRLRHMDILLTSPSMKTDAPLSSRMRAMATSLYRHAQCNGPLRYVELGKVGWREMEAISEQFFGDCKGALPFVRRPWRSRWDLSLFPVEVQPLSYLCCGLLQSAALCVWETQRACLSASPRPSCCNQTRLSRCDNDVISQGT